MTIQRTVSVIVALAVAGGLVVGCPRMGRSIKMSSCVIDGTVGLNGGFETTESGLPVNWSVYTPKTIPTGDYDLVIDTAECHAGKQSLKFVVRDCSADGGWRSPGFCREFPATPGTTYTVGFWVKNDGAEFLAKIGGVTATQGRYETIVRSGETIAAWKYFEHKYTMPPGFKSIRFELNVLRPGTFWIDEVTISGIQ